MYVDKEGQRKKPMCALGYILIYFASYFCHGLPISLTILLLTALNCLPCTSLHHPFSFQCFFHSLLLTPVGSPFQVTSIFIFIFGFSHYQYANGSIYLQSYLFHFQFRLFYFPPIIIVLNYTIPLVLLYCFMYLQFCFHCVLYFVALLFNCLYMYNLLFAVLSFVGSPPSLCYVHFGYQHNGKRNNMKNR